MPEPNFTRQAKPKLLTHNDMYIYPKDLKGSHFMQGQSKVAQTWTKNVHVSLLSQVTLLKLSAQKAADKHPSLPLHPTHSGQAGPVFQGLQKQHENENGSSTISGVFYKSIIK